MKDHCDPNPCKMGGHCISGHTSFTCRCPSGYTGRVCSECKYDVSYCLKSFFLLYQLPSMFFPTSTHHFFRTQPKAIPALFSFLTSPTYLLFPAFFFFHPKQLSSISSPTSSPHVLEPHSLGHFVSSQYCQN